MFMPEDEVPGFYQEDLSVYDTNISEPNTDVQDSYNLGLITSTFAWSSLTAGFAYMVGAEVGVVSAFLIWTSPIHLPVTGTLAAANVLSGTRQYYETSRDVYARGGYEKSSGTTADTWWWPSWLWGDFTTPEYHN